MWRKSTKSGGAQDCVEVDTDAPTVGVRDSKDQAGAVLRFDPRAWVDFLDVVKTGAFDRPSTE